MLSKMTKEQQLENEQLLESQLHSNPNGLMYSIREHNAVQRKEHIDICLGDPTAKYTADFVVSKYKTFNELLTALESLNKVAVIPVSIHPANPFLRKPVGSTGYDVGEWKIIQRGNAIPKGQHRSFSLSGSGLRLYHFRTNMWYIKSEGETDTAKFIDVSGLHKNEQRVAFLREYVNEVNSVEEFISICRTKGLECTRSGGGQWAYYYARKGGALVGFYDAGDAGFMLKSVRKGFRNEDDMRIGFNMD
jgi:hypothetical protein